MKSSQVPPQIDKNKVDYIFEEFFNSCRRYRVVTKGAIESVLRHLPKLAGKVTPREMARININLLVPLNADSILEITRIANEYDKLLTNLVFINNSQANHEPFVPANHRKCGTYNL